MHGKNWIWALALIVLAGGIAAATPVYGTAVSSSDWTGTRTLVTGIGGLGSYSGDNKFKDGTGISWMITFDSGSGYFNYSYSFFEPGKDEKDKGKKGKDDGGTNPLEVSHFILELSQGCVAEGQSSCIWGANVGNKDLEFSEEWKYSPPSKSNIGMPNPIYGVKFDEEKSTYTFISDRIPVWGNFYAKKGQDGLWNLGLETAYSGSDNTLYFIPRPDTESVPEIPEPGTMALLGAGLTALGLLRRRN
jgi:hypothetical protein